MEELLYQSHHSSRRLLLQELGRRRLPGTLKFWLLEAEEVVEEAHSRWERVEVEVEVEVLHITHHFLLQQELYIRIL
jgi:hypothetical protein